IVTQSVSVTVTKALPTITTWPVASSITYGQTLSTSTLSGEVVVSPGLFAFTDPDTVPNAGTLDFSVIYTPADTLNFNALVQSVNVLVQAKPIVVTGITIDNKVYDGTVDAMISGTAALSGIEAADAANLALSGTATAVFMDATVGTAKAVIVSGYMISGTTAGNYTLSQPAGLTASISAKPLTIRGIVIPKKIYDGTPTATMSGGSLVGIISGDSVNFTGGSAAFSDPDVENNKSVTVSGILLTGAQAANYSLIQPTGLVSAITIQPPSLAPVVKSLFADTVRTGTTVLLSADTVPLATGYRIQLSSDLTFSPSLVDTIVTNISTFLADKLGADSRWYFRIAGINEGGDGPWSKVNHFTTMPADANSRGIITGVLTDTLVTLSPDVSLNVNSADAALNGAVITMMMSSKALNDKAVKQISGLFDFSKSPQVRLDDSIRLNFTFPDTSFDGIPNPDSAFVKTYLYMVDSTGGLHAVFNAKIDHSAKKISYSTNRMGVFTLGIDTTPPAVIDNTIRLPKGTGSTPAITGQILDNIKNCRGHVYFRKGGSYTFDSLPATINADGTFSLSLDGVTLDLNGFEYYIVASDGAHIVSVGRQDIPVKLTSTSDTTAIPQGQWHLFSSPMKLSDDQISSVLKNMGNYGKDWKLFRRSLTSIADSFVEYGPNLSTIGTGYSYWLKTQKNDLRLSVDSGTTSPVSHSYEIVMPAKTWAAVGNPYLFPVGWQSILDSSGTEGTKLIGPYTYQDSTWITPLQCKHLDPWHGYYVFNSSDSAITMRIPSLRYHMSAAKKLVDSLSFFKWSVSSTAGNDYNNFFGIVKNATVSYDRALDYPKPGTPGADGPVTWFSRNDFKHISSRFQTDFTSSKDGGASWSVKVGNLKKGLAYCCAVSGIDFTDDILKMVLVDHHAGIVYDFALGKYEFSPFDNEDVRKLEIVAGTQEYIDRYINKLRLPPSKLALNIASTHQGVLTIRYALPWSAVPVPVSLEMFNIRGQLVTTLVKDIRTPGYYTFQWNSRKTWQASGVNVLRLRAGKKQIAKKVQVVK
ncbi:MAG: fibronectin type III domain-containing protein, partial [Fibrobacter sp.]|nr:fibronectin type III domain-containing protein [Fibrobacter sp.]